jgi:hypothetical protein
MRKIRRSQIGLDGRTVEKDDRVLHGVIFLWFDLVQISLQHSKWPRIALAKQVRSPSG